MKLENNKLIQTTTSETEIVHDFDQLIKRRDGLKIRLDEVQALIDQAIKLGAVESPKDAETENVVVKEVKPKVKK